VRGEHVCDVKAGEVRDWRGSVLDGDAIVVKDRNGNDEGTAGCSISIHSLPAPGTLQEWNSFANSERRANNLAPEEDAHAETLASNGLQHFCWPRAY
jgi:hypothetical protein